MLFRDGRGVFTAEKGCSNSGMLCWRERCRFGHGHGDVVAGWEDEEEYEKELEGWLVVEGNSSEET